MNAVLLKVKMITHSLLVKAHLFHFVLNSCQHLSQGSNLYLILSTALEAQYLPHNEELSALIKQNHHRMEVEGCSRLVIQDCGYDREGRKTKLGS